MRTKIKETVAGVAALDGFGSPVERNDTGPGKMSYRFATNGSRFLPLLLTGGTAKITVLYRSFSS